MATVVALVENNILVALVTTGGVVLVGLIGYLTARLTRKSTLIQTRVEERGKLIEGYDKLNEDLEKRNTKLTEELEGLKTRMDTLEHKRGEDRDRIWQLEEDKQMQVNAMRKIIEYCELLVMILKSHKINVPDEPEEMKVFGKNVPPPNPDR
jgi:hypothetical protein